MTLLIASTLSASTAAACASRAVSILCDQPWQPVAVRAYHAKGSPIGFVAGGYPLTADLYLSFGQFGKLAPLVVLKLCQSVRVTREPTVDPTEAIIETIRRLVTAWNSKDEFAFGAFFTEEARYTGTDGLLRQGRAQIAALLHEHEPHTRVSVAGPISVGILGSQATAKFRWTSLPIEQRGRAGLIDCRLVMEPDCWRISVLVNTIV